ncbi:MAG: VCBS repeat-containing protein, partial [Pedobacter sp.]
CDFDGDGDTDVFIGSRSVPGVYGINPKQMLLANDGKGNFTDVTEKMAYKLKDIGMVTDAVWEDVDNDNKKDLILVGDWMAPTILKNTGRRLAEFKTNLNNEMGFWNAVVCVDLNNDGKKDFVFGNKGTNTSYKCSKSAPMKLFVNDFDNNGTIEQIGTQTLDHKDMPLHLKSELAKQIPSIKKKNLNYSAYAKKSIQELFSTEVIANSIKKVANIQESIVAINGGNGKFMIKALPKEAQFSTVNAILASDINNDGNVDLILGGNQYEFKPQYGRLDASFGTVLLGSKTADFTFLPADQSGVSVNGKVKAIKNISNKNKKSNILMVLNNNKPKIFKSNE